MLLLVVDDDELSRELLTMLLEAEGYDVEAVSSGEAALVRLLHPPSPGIILTDLQMPGLAGSSLIQALRGASEGDTKIIVMSGSQPEASLLEDADCFLLKPFTPEDLAAVLKLSDSPDAATMAEESHATGQDAFPGPPLLNEDIYANLAEVMPATQLKQMYALYLSDARSRIGQMNLLAQAGADAAYREAAHAVKGGSGLIGATELYRLAGLAETHGLSFDSPSHSTVDLGTKSGAALPGTGVAVLLDQMSLACDRLERILEVRSSGFA